MGEVELVPREYGYVVIVLVLYCFLNFWMAAQVGRARKKYNVPYPTMYASAADNKDANLFNCVQRGHQNSIEMMPMFFLLMALGGIRHPVIAASLGVGYSISRFFYFKGYSTGDPKKRLSIGKYGFLATLGLMICTISCGVGMLTA
ncbi:microsomal glutathione s-transferase [Perilla frutescens var. frutescens]|nr:microsomal glutathione s-transferase [Perilla frutescens var. frutescens]